jgi:CubicO group peptidase (beta-lactamase class C family)
MRAVRWGLILAAAALVNLGYWRDPWLWRRYSELPLQLAGFGPRIARPAETVAGAAASLAFPVADAEGLVVRPSALKAAEDFAARFDSYALIVLHRGVIQSEWYGPGWYRESLAQSQSMHETLVAMLTGIALDRGLIRSIDDPLGTYLAEWRADPRGRTTLRQLLMMSSGLAQRGFSLNPASDDFGWLFGTHTESIILSTPQSDWAPGSMFDYNNINSELLGLLLQRRTGKRYAELLSEYIWQPMGGEDALVWLDREGGSAHVSCCLMATAMDWARLGQLMLNRGQLNGREILPARWVDEMIATSTVHPWYGLQLWLGYPRGPNPRSARREAMGAYDQKEPFLARDVYYFSGHAAQRVYVVPSRELVIVRLGPAMGLRPLKPGWDNAYLVNTIIRGMTPAILASNART